MPQPLTPAEGWPKDPWMSSSAPSTTGTNEPWTIGRVLAWVTKDFAAREFDSPRLEAELLLSHVLGCNRIQLIVDRDRPLTPEELAAYRAMVARRRGHEPVAYLRGEREFYGHMFRVDARVLIPRPDTESLVEVALRRTRDKDMFGHMADVCTGSGNVAIAFSRERPTWRILATDVSRDAIALAEENAVRVGAAWNLSFAVGDLLEPLGRAHYDLITANPPYIPTAEIETLPADVRKHEPRMALDGGVDGLAVIRRLVADAPGKLADNGVLAFEIGCDQGQSTATLLQSAGWRDVEVEQDLGRRDRVVSGIRPLG